MRTARWHQGLLLGILGMLSFSGTLPATHLAVPTIGPLVLTFGRIVVAALLGVALLAASKTPIPPRRYVPGFIATGLGWSLLYPLFVALGLQSAPSAHGAVIVGLIPAVTALISVLRAHERPPLVFWVACLGGFATVLAYIVVTGGGSVTLADFYFVVALVSTSISYVEGAQLSNALGSRTVLCWSLIAMTPISVPVLIVASGFVAWDRVPPEAWGGFAYVCAISMFFGSLAWYKGLAIGGIARISQLLALQPIVAIALAAWVGHEPVTPRDIVFACLVVIAVAVCIKSSVRIQPAERIVSSHAC